jgi:hypothetical protein
MNEEWQQKYNEISEPSPPPQTYRHLFLMEYLTNQPGEAMGDLVLIRWMDYTDARQSHRIVLTDRQTALQLHRWLCGRPVEEVRTLMFKDVLTGAELDPDNGLNRKRPVR